MIRARLSNGDFLMGIDAENVRRLTSGHPLIIDLTPLGGTDKLLITYGHTLDDIKRELEEALGMPLPTPSPWPENDGQPS